jgi:hypothetical protein
VAVVAIDTTIHAAIVGGVLGGAVVLAGIGLTEWLRRLGDRRSAAEAAVHELVVWLPIWLVHYSRRPPQEDSEIDSKWVAQQRMTDALFRVESSLNQRGLRHRQKIAAAVDDLSARTAAVMLRRMDGKLLSDEDMIEINARELRALVLGDRKPIDDLISRYRRDGFPPNALGEGRKPLRQSP